MVFCTIVSQTERDRTLSTQLVVGVLSDGQFVVLDVHVKGRTAVRSTEVNSAGGPGVDLAVRSLLVGHVSDVGTGSVRHIAQELGVRTESFWEDVVEAIIFCEDRRTVSKVSKAHIVTNHWCVVHIVHRVGDVVRVAQSVAVGDLEGEHHVSELVV